MKKQKSPRTQVSGVTEFGEIRIQGDAVLSQHMKLFGKHIKLQVNVLEFIIYVCMPFTQFTPLLLVMCMNLTYCIELISIRQHLFAESTGTDMLRRTVNVDIETLIRLGRTQGLL